MGGIRRTEDEAEFVLEMVWKEEKGLHTIFEIQEKAKEKGIKLMPVQIRGIVAGLKKKGYIVAVRAANRSAYADLAARITPDGKPIKTKAKKKKVDA